MRKLLLSLACLMFMAGLVLAAEVTLKSYKDKMLTVTDADGKEMKYTVTDKTKITRTQKKQDKDVTMEDFEKQVSDEKNAGKMKMDVTADGSNLTEIKMKGGGRKGKKKDPE